MLKRLTLKNFVIVKALDLEITQGFTVLTGETGAGKSILLDALGLILGNRADANVVAQGADKADITAEFDSNPSIDAWLKEADLTNDDEYILIRRVIDTQGKSRAFINGIACTVAQLKELGEQLVHIHGQHAHQLLLKANAQRDLIDHHAQLKQERQATFDAYHQWQKSQRAFDAANHDADQLKDKLSALEWQLDGLEQLSPQANEWEHLSSEHTRLAHAESLIQGSARSAHALNQDDDSIVDRVQEQINTISSLLPMDERLQEATELLDAALIHLQEAGHFLNNYAQRSDLNESLFEQLDERMTDWLTQARKLRVAPEDLHTHWLALQKDKHTLQAGLDLEQLEAQAQLDMASYQAAAKILSQARQQAAQKLSAQVTESMQLLNMTGGQFVVDITKGNTSAYGTDNIELLVSGHAGSRPQALNKVASGGELARISLALSVITSSANPVATLIFDEVDSGIGGAVAQVVGKLLAQLGQSRQVLCVTHLAQVAAQGQHHWRVRKETLNGQTHSSIDILTDYERTDEIARMLGGIEITQTTHQHAKEMLGQSK